MFSLLFILLFSFFCFPVRIHNLAQSTGGVIFPIWVKQKPYLPLCPLPTLVVARWAWNSGLPSVVSIDIMGRGGGRKGLITGQQRWKSWLPWFYLITPCISGGIGHLDSCTQPLLMWLKPRFFHGVWWVELLLPKNFVLLGCSFPNPLTRESRVLLGLFFFLFCAHWLFWIASSNIFGSKVWGIWGRKKTQETHHPVIFRSWGTCWSNFSLLFRVFLYLFYIQCPGVLVSLSRRTREKCICFSFPVVEIQKWCHLPWGVSPTLYFSDFIPMYYLLCLSVPCVFRQWWVHLEALVGLRFDFLARLFYGCAVFFCQEHMMPHYHCVPFVADIGHGVESLTY